MLKKWLAKAVGEISKLRTTIGGLNIGSASVPYVLNSEKVNYELARQLYKNIHDDYKLGAGFAKPIINTLAGFMGVPKFICVDADAQIALDALTETWVSKQQRTHILSLVQGECFVMLANLKTNPILYPNEQTRIAFLIIPPEQVGDDIEIDPVTKEILAVTLSGRVRWGSKGQEKEYTYTHRITADKVERKVEGEAPAGVKSFTEDNLWGFVPIVHFKNEPEENALHGFSELEPVEPYLKAYHDVLLHAMQGSKMHSTPKVKLKLKDVKKFLDFNFPDALKAITKGEQATINLSGRELLLLNNEEDASFIECQSAIGDAKGLLQLLFYCIVDVSEIPEFVFGVHMSSAHASVKEQGPLLVRRVTRKREQVTECWQLLARMVLAMQSHVTGKQYSSYACSITWDAVLDRDEKEYAETLKNVVDAVTAAVEKNVMSHEAASNLLTQYIDTMVDYTIEGEEGEREKIVRDRFMMSAIESGDALAGHQKDKIEAVLAAAQKKSSTKDT